MTAAEFLIERLQEQIKLAPAENRAAGGSVASMLERCIEQMNLAGRITKLKFVAVGPRRYAAHFARAREQVAKLGPLIDGTAGLKPKDVREQVAAVCQAALVELEAALAILDEADKNEAAAFAQPK